MKGKIIVAVVLVIALIGGIFAIGWLEFNGILQFYNGPCSCCMV